MNWSIGLRTQRASRPAAAGGSGRTGGTNAQWVSHFAPSSIQRRSRSIWCAVSVWPVSSGGIRSSTSGLVMRSTSRLPAASPGTMTPFLANAPSRVSKWNLVSRLFSSGPWQAKQLFDRMGSTSRLKLTATAPGGAPASPRTARVETPAAPKHENARPSARA